MPKRKKINKFRISPGEELISSFTDGLGVQPAKKAPPRKEGEGQFKRLVIRGAMLIDGTGAPLHGPADIVISKNLIQEVRVSGFTPPAEPGDFEIDASGMYILPGFIEAHTHIGNPLQGITSGPIVPAEYVFKLWLAHGITTVRECGAHMGLKWTLDQQKKSDSNRITAPRIHTYPTLWPPELNSDISTPEEIRAWIAEVHQTGISGIKYFGGPPVMTEILYDECRERGLRTACHHMQMYSGQITPMDAALMGLTSMEHHYGLPIALCSKDSVHKYPLDHNDSDERMRFLEDGRMWRHTDPDGDRWNEVIDTMLQCDFTIDPTLTIYEAARDVMRAMRAEWHDEYTLPSLWQFYQPSPIAHGSFYCDWTTSKEIEWKENFQYWMHFLNDYKDRGGRVAVGSDAGFIYKLYGFDYIREFELLQEAGFHPLEVIRAATLKGAELLGLEKELGTIHSGKKADLVIVEENPIMNFKTLYGTGHMKLNDQTGQVERVGGVRWTIKDGIVYDAKQLLADVRNMVTEANKAGS